jgi:hypothetical protein
MKLMIEIPSNCVAERTYILDVLLREFLGLEFDLKISESLNVTRITGCYTKMLVIDDCFFDNASKNWLGGSSMPQEPCQRIALKDLGLAVRSLKRDIPVFFGVPSERRYRPVELMEKTIVCHIDIFGTCFFLLSRYEEAVNTRRDEFDRFPFSASVLSSDELINRPIVNEYLELLWSCLNNLWPDLERLPRTYQAILTHDVDRPLLMAGVSITGLFKKLGAALLHYRSLGMATRRLVGFTRGMLGDLDADPFNTFTFIMDTAEQHGMLSAFYFITDRSAGAMDCNYTLQDPWIRALIRRIHERGHEIGIHGSFNTYKSRPQTKLELDILKASCQEEGIVLSNVGGRQHYLRWSALDTWDIWNAIGIDYDSTLGFAERAGFRAGTCYEYPVYSLKHRRQLSLKERPLIVMDGTLMAKKYMGLGFESATPLVKELIDTCKFYQGNFVCLFHNSSLETENQKRFFAEIVAEASQA